MVLGKASRPKSDYGVYRSDLPVLRQTAIPRNSLLVGYTEVIQKRGSGKSWLACTAPDWPST